MSFLRSAWSWVYLFYKGHCSLLRFLHLLYDLWSLRTTWISRFLMNFMNLMILFVCLEWFTMFLEINGLCSIMECDDAWQNRWCWKFISNRSGYFIFFSKINTMNELYLSYTVEIDHLKNLPIFHMIFSI